MQALSQVWSEIPGTNFDHLLISLIMNYVHSERVFFPKIPNFGLGQTNWSLTFWGIWGIFCWTISTHFGILGSLSMFSINQPLFLQKTFISKSQKFIEEWELNLGRKELGI
jgi:hypothetical protein